MECVRASLWAVKKKASRTNLNLLYLREDMCAGLPGLVKLCSGQWGEQPLGGGLAAAGGAHSLWYAGIGPFLPTPTPIYFTGASLLSSKKCLRNRY